MQIARGNVQVFDLRLFEITAGIVPPTGRFFPLFAYIFADIADGPGIIVI
jgi:hypothetical protein